MSKVARDLILNLLNRNPQKRMGASARDAEELKEHEFFEGIDWDEVYNLKLKMPEIDVKPVTQSSDAEKAFKEGEAVSKATMEKLYKQIKKEDGLKDVKAKDEANKIF